MFAPEGVLQTLHAIIKSVLHLSSIYNNYNVVVNGYVTSLGDTFFINMTVFHKGRL